MRCLGLTSSAQPFLTSPSSHNHQHHSPPAPTCSVSRMTVYDQTYAKIPTMGWMFLPLQDYHGGGPDAAFEPMSQHLAEYEMGLAQYLGAGIAACYRGFRLYDTPEVQAVVAKWVATYKAHRAIITSDIVHIRRPDGQALRAACWWSPLAALPARPPGACVPGRPPLPTPPRCCSALTPLPLRPPPPWPSSPLCPRAPFSVVGAMQQRAQLRGPQPRPRPLAAPPPPAFQARAPQCPFPRPWSALTGVMHDSFLGDRSRGGS